MNNYLVSIIIPVYNGEKTILQTLKDIKNQSYQNLEIIVVNDGSKDDTEKIILSEMELDNRICYFSIENSGVSAARNIGLKHLNGDFVTFIDSDDRVDHNMIEKLMNILVINNADISACLWDDIYLDDQCSFLYPKEEVIVYERERAIEEALKGVNVSSSITAKLFKSELFEQIRFPEHLTIIEDAYIILELFFHVKYFAQTNLRMYKYIHRSGSLMNREFIKKDELCVIETHEKNLQLIQKQMPELSFVANQRLAWAYLHIYDRLITSNYEDPIFEKSIRKEIITKSHYINSGDYFNFGRKFAVFVLRFSPFLYKKLVKYRGKNYQVRKS